MHKAILVGTYHKTGTVWMANVFRDLADRLSIPFYDLSGDAMPSAEQKAQLVRQMGAGRVSGIVFDDHCRFDPNSIDAGWFRGVRMIRDPRDIVVSSAKYHGWSQEEWLHQPRGAFGGLSYQQQLNSYRELDDKLLFEMRQASRHTILQMLNFRGGGVFATVRYEDLITDYGLELWHRVLAHLGLTGDLVPLADQAFLDNTIFGNQDLLKQDHVQNGKPRQYEEVFSQTVAQRFAQRFPGVAAGLGYPAQDEPVNLAALYYRFINRHYYELSRMKSTLGDLLKKANVYTQARS